MDIFGSNDVHRITDAGAYIIDLKVRIVILNNGIKGEACKDQFQDPQHGDSRPSHTRFTKMNVWIDCNAFFHLSSSFARMRAKTALEGNVFHFTLTPPITP